MASALPKHDVSLTWPTCGRPGCAQRRHRPEFPCPPGGTWLVALYCPACRNGVYCARHTLREYVRPVVTAIRQRGGRP